MASGQVFRVNLMMLMLMAGITSRWLCHLGTLHRCLGGVTTFEDTNSRAGRSDSLSSACHAVPLTVRIGFPFGLLISAKRKVSFPQCVLVYLGKESFVKCADSTSLRYLEYRPFSSQRLLALPPLFLTRLISLTAAALPSKLKDLLALLLSKNPQGSSCGSFFFFFQSED